MKKFLFYKESAKANLLIMRVSQS